jgi:hypothetical protein
MRKEKTGHGEQRICVGFGNQSEFKITYNTKLKVLARGFKFRPSLDYIPVEDYIIATESAIKSTKMPAESAIIADVNTVAFELERMIKLEKREGQANKSNLFRRSKKML